MLRTETGSFNRLLTSLGLVLMGAALVVPYFYFRAADILEITRTELNALTPVARTALEGRQSGISTLEPYVLVFALLLFSGGGALLAWGAVRLREVQDRDDREAEARTRIVEADVRDLTPTEREDKLTEDAAPPPNEEAREQAEEQPPANVEVTADERPGEPIRRLTFKERRQALSEIEAAVQDAFDAEPIKTHRFRAQVAVSGIKLNGLFLTDDPRYTDVVLEISLGTGNMLSPLNRVDRMLSTLARYQARSGRPASAWMLVVVPRKEPSQSTAPTRETLGIQLNSALAPLGKASVVLEEDLDILPRVFFSEILRGARTPPSTSS